MWSRLSDLSRFKRGSSWVISTAGSNHRLEKVSQMNGIYSKNKDNVLEIYNLSGHDDVSSCTIAR